MKKFLFVFILFLTSCGYESVNKLDKLNYTITKYEFTGNQQVNKILKKILIGYKMTKLLQMNLKFCKK